MTERETSAVDKPKEKCPAPGSLFPLSSPFRRAWTGVQKMLESSALFGSSNSYLEHILQWQNYSDKVN